MGLKKVIISLFVIIYLIVFTPQYLYGYIDPGSIAILLQLLIAGIAGALVAFRRYVALVFKKLFKIGKEE